MRGLCSFRLFLEAPSERSKSTGCNGKLAYCVLGKFSIMLCCKMRCVIPCWFRMERWKQLLEKVKTKYVNCDIIGKVLLPRTWIFFDMLCPDPVILSLGPRVLVDLRQKSISKLDVSWNCLGIKIQVPYGSFMAYCKALLSHRGASLFLNTQEGGLLEHGAY